MRVPARGALLGDFVGVPSSDGDFDRLNRAVGPARAYDFSRSGNLNGDLRARDGPGGRGVEVGMFECSNGVVYALG